VSDFLDSLPEPEFLTDGPRVCAWIYEYLRHPGGKTAGQRFALEPWQVDYIYDLFRVDESGVRIFSESLLALPRKNGKSSLVAALGLYALVGDGADDAPECIVAANSRDQASVLFRMARAMVEESDGLSEFVDLKQYHLESPANRGTLRVIASEARLAHGTSVSFSALDEYHGAKDSDLYVALTSGTGARNEPLSLIISTVGYDRRSPLGELYDAADRLPDELREIRRGGFLEITRDTENGFLSYIFGPPRTADGYYSADLDDLEVAANCNPASWITADYLRRQRDKPSVRISDYRRFHLNAWTLSEDSWLDDPRAWDDGGEGFEPIEDGARVYVGVDLGQKRDNAAIVTLRAREVELPDGTIEVHADATARIWTPPEEGSIDINEISSWIVELCDRFEVAEVAFDPWRFSSEAARLLDRGVPMVEFPMTNARTAPATELLYEAITARKLHHDGDRHFAAHIAAAGTTETERGFRLTKRKSVEPMDAAVALMIAYARAVVGDGESESIYEEQDLLILE
jgi:phage terminase large subunit-like protein